MSSSRERFTTLKEHRISKIIFLTLPIIITLLSITSLHAEEKTRILIGAVEEVVLFPWGAKLPARIDTGAGMTSLDVRDLTVRNKVAQFRLPEKYGDSLISLPVIRHCNVRSAGSKNLRPVVEIDVCVGSKRMRVHVNLSNRSHLEYPMILGRNVLNQGFMVDCAQEKMLSPKCMEGVSQ
jgi:hypothetical protein